VNPFTTDFLDNNRDVLTVNGHARAPIAMGIERVLDRANGERAVSHHDALCRCLGILRQEAGEGLHDGGAGFPKCLHPHGYVAHADVVSAHRGLSRRLIAARRDRAGITPGVSAWHIQARAGAFHDPRSPGLTAIGVLPVPLVARLSVWPVRHTMKLHALPVRPAHEGGMTFQSRSRD
jgi:hypothetical protein